MSITIIPFIRLKCYFGFTLVLFQKQCENCTVSIYPLRGNNDESFYTNELIMKIASYMKQNTPGRRYMLTSSPLCHNKARDIFICNSGLFDQIFIDYTSVCVPNIGGIFYDV